MKKSLKRISAVLLAVVMLISSISLTASAYVTDENGIIHFTEEETLEKLKYEIANGEVTVTDCTAYSDYKIFEFVVPEKIEGYPVTAVAEQAFMDCQGMIKCTLPHTVRTIGDEAFKGVYDLTEFVANGVTEIGSNAFWGTSIAEVVLSETLEKIAPDTFKRCEYIKSFTVSYNNEHFFTRNGVLFNKAMTELLAFPALTEDFGDTYTVPETVTVIADYAFGNCTYNTVLKTIVLTGVKTIGVDAFAHCPATTITLNDGVESIGEAAFYGSEIEAMVLPDSVKTIGMEAFRWCESLKSINIPEGVIRLEDYMFNASNVEELYLPSTLTYLGTSSCPYHSPKVYYNGTQEDWRKLQEYEKSSGFDSSEIFFNDGTSHKHDFAWRTVLNANCTEKGLEEYGCPDCNILYETREIEPLDHASDYKWKVLKTPTTTSEGEMAQHCIRCNEVVATQSIQKLGACVYQIRYEKSYDTHNTFTMSVAGRATMVQFIEPDGGTRTYDRNNKNVTIKSYTYYGAEVSDLSRELNYEVWTINTNLTADVEIKVRAKYVKDNGYTWDNAMNKFTVELLAPDKKVYAIERLDGSSATLGQMGPVEVKVTTGAKADGLRFVMPNGTKTTYSAANATVLEDGKLQFVGKFWANDMGANVIQVQTKLAGGKWETVKEFTYNADEYPY